MTKQCCDCEKKTDDLYPTGVKDYFRCRDCHEKLIRDSVRESIDASRKMTEESIVRKF